MLKEQSQTFTEHLETNQQLGSLFVISAPSGTGKSTLLTRLLNKMDNLQFSISYTTRAARAGEQHGKHYYFVSVEEFFNLKKKGEFVEFAEVHGNFYGTSRVQINREIKLGKDILLDIDVQGAAVIKQSMPGSISIFLLPPSYKILSERLKKRGLDTDAVIEQRLHNATIEISHCKNFSYVVINDDLDEATDVLVSIIKAERHRGNRLWKTLDTVIASFETKVD